MSEKSAGSSAGWLYHPQRLKWRRALFQIHLWSGLCLGLYIFFISITGSVLVFRNELYVAATPRPVVSAEGTLLSEGQLRAQVLRSYPDSEITRFVMPREPGEAAEIWLQDSEQVRKRFFDPRTAEDVGSAARTGQNLVTMLINLHESFLAGPTGRNINGIGAFFVLLLACTGLVIWWPGLKRWRKSLIVHRGAGWKRQLWELHSMVGIWSVLFILIFSLSGLYLCFPNFFHDMADRIQPITDENAGRRFVDRALYWLAFLHFGRINGIGLGCDGPGLCDQSVKAMWALFGLAPATMFVSGAAIWWNRVLRRWWRQSTRRKQS